MSSGIGNPIPEIISDDSFKMMLEEGLLGGVGIRNYIIRKDFRILRKENSQEEAIHILCDKYFMSYYQMRRLLFYKKSEVTSRSENWVKYNLIKNDNYQ